MYKIACMGDSASIGGFAALGLETFPLDSGDPEKAAAMLKTLARGGYAVIYVTEELAAVIKDEIDKYREKPETAVILIPGVKGNTGEGLEGVGRSVEKAVGSNILENQN